MPLTLKVFNVFDGVMYLAAVPSRAGAALVATGHAFVAINSNLQLGLQASPKVLPGDKPLPKLLPRTSVSKCFKFLRCLS